MSDKVRVYIDGEAGTTGLSLRRRLESRPDIELLHIPEAQRKDASIRKEYLNAADFVCLCLPDDASREAVGLIENPTVRVLDASTAFRTAPDWVYGLPELSGEQRQAITETSRLSVPGCHASGFLALAAPLVASGILPRDYPVCAYSITGYSGGGKRMIADYENADRDPAFSGTRMYGLNLQHKHLKEMQAHSDLWHSPLFCPVLGDFAQGMLVSIPLHTRLLARHADAPTVREALAAHYQGSRFVQVQPYAPDLLPDGGFLNPQALNGSNDMELFVFGGEEQVLVAARLDNLGKGSGGAAVQCLNLMMGADEDAGL